jgi:protein-S-isoprenylcysteine O-methyltransferase Ste14
VGAGRRRRDEGHLDIAVSSRSRSCVVLRADGAARGGPCCRLPDRLGRHTMIDPYLLVRAASLYVTVVLTIAIYGWRRPSRGEAAGALLASLWNLPTVLLLHLAAVRLGWWRYEAEGGLLLGMPVDLYLSWAWIWGAAAALALPRAQLLFVAMAALAIDLVLMPAAFPVVRLGPMWLVGEIIGLVAVLVPGQLLARWTVRQERLAARVALQAIAFGGLVFFVLPVVAVEGSGGRFVNPLDRPAWQLSVILQGFATPAVLGLTAVQEFATRGLGTPIPFDPPTRLVTTGIYAYIRNPMALSAIVLLFLSGLVLHNPWVSAAGLMAHVYSMGLAGWDEDEDLRRRFGDRWTIYRRSVPRWIPRLTPWHAPGEPPAYLYVAEGCEMCQGVRQWVEQRNPHDLEIVAAQCHVSGALTRLAYEPADKEGAVTGVAALARALEHLHLGWALLGCALRLPGVCRVAQLLIDASGGGPRTIARSPTSRRSRSRQPW